MMSRLIYFDNASTSFPKPLGVIKYMENYCLNIGVNPGRGLHQQSKFAEEYIFQVRRKVANLFNIKDPSHLIFTSGATHSLNIVIKGYFHEGDHTLICNFSHNAVIRPIEQMKAAGILNYDIFHINPEGEINEEELIKLIKKNTRMIILNHASNVIGIQAPLNKICKIARKYKLHFLLDCSQSALYVQLNMLETDIDFLVGTGHKSLLGPSGVGFLYIKEPNLLNTLMQGGSNGNDSASPYHPETLPYKFEAGTINFMGIAGLAGALSYIESNLESIKSSISKITLYALKKLAEIPEVTIYGSKEMYKKVPIISFNVKERLPSEIAYVLDKKFSIAVRAGLHCAPLIHSTLETFPCGTVRLSFSHMNTLEEIDYLCKALNFIIKN